MPSPMESSRVAPRLDALQVPADVRRAAGEFVDEVLAHYRESLVSIMAFGSAVSGDFDPGESDVNLFVVHASLDIEDLDRMGDLSRRWLRQRMIAPRFLSTRNFQDYLRYFPVDVLAMRGATAVIWGEDLLSTAEVPRDALRWQSAYEIKTMRLRIKQQYWRVADDAEAMRRVLVQRFTSLTHLMRAALVLRGQPAPSRRVDVIDAAVTHLGISRSFVDRVMALRHDDTRPDRATLVALFGDLLDAIRAVDAAIDEAGG